VKAQLQSALLSQLVSLTDKRQSNGRQSNCFNEANGNRAIVDRLKRADETFALRIKFLIVDCIITAPKEQIFWRQLFHELSC
jgi:hypothetical protein